MDPAAWAALGGLGTAVVTTAGGYFATRTRVKVEDVATVQADLDEAREDLKAERAAWEADRDAMRDRAAAERQAMEERHAQDLESHQRRVRMLEEMLAERDRAITKLDRVVLALRAYVARLSSMLVSHDVTPPPRPAEVDE